MPAIEARTREDGIEQGTPIHGIKSEPATSTRRHATGVSPWAGVTGQDGVHLLGEAHVVERDVIAAGDDEDVADNEVLRERRPAHAWTCVRASRDDPRRRRHRCRDAAEDPSATPVGRDTVQVGVDAHDATRLLIVEHGRDPH
ncbi:hypothetical protein [Clavibacter zhangzhiyongii]|uniref:Uncharacterized protein n=1 Tax=Clavibacter zhangzhiyongii TaxID=2768071 RepID=A0A7L7YYV9_9MICO|nr:hypothetical protein [Clavibacter zhangzhiyongii]QOD42632.1 hypothetical protein H9X71_08215 [Clavibacter zhangzhiyongii]